jgi:hypothetical protein
VWRTGDGSIVRTTGQRRTFEPFAWWDAQSSARRWRGKLPQDRGPGGHGTARPTWSLLPLRVGSSVVSIVIVFINVAFLFSVNTPLALSLVGRQI